MGFATKPMLSNKKGLSPVIATTLLILVAVILAAIIFWWIRTFVQESVQKNLGGGPEPIQNFCPDVKFNADVSDGTITVQNNGQVPIYGVEVKQKGFASLKSIGEATDSSLAIKTGETYTFSSAEYSGSPLTGAGSLTIIPILLGESGSSQKAYPCDTSYGVPVTAA